MQSHAGPQLVAELPQCLKKQQAIRSVATIGAWRLKERKPVSVTSAIPPTPGPRLASDVSQPDLVNCGAHLIPHWLALLNKGPLDFFWIYGG